MAALKAGAGSVAVVVRCAGGADSEACDVRVECEAAWSVERLKQHLHQVYPTHPKTEEQKIIYSGQLLDDSTILKDVLRVYEGQEAHTMHLVCTPKRYKMSDISRPSENSTSADGLRRRNAANENNEPQRTEAPPRPETRQNDQNHSVEMQNFFSSMVNNYGRVPPNYATSYSGFGGYYPVPNDPVAMANHMVMMQQAYMQYMQQYANMWQTGGATPGAPPVHEAPPQQAVPEQAAPDPQAEDPENEPALPRDWLDWVYAISRMAILFSLVYFYSSPFRFLLVMLLGVFGYLYQLGFFQELGFNARNEQREQNEPIIQPNQNQNDPRPAQNHNEADNAEPTSADAPENNESVAETQDNQQSVFSFTWMIFTSFFTSLIPETPNAV